MKVPDCIDQSDTVALRLLWKRLHCLSIELNIELNAGERSFRYAASAVWNSLPNSIRNTPTLAAFKRQLKTHLFRQAFPNL